MCAPLYQCHQENTTPRLQVNERAPPFRHRKFRHLFRVGEWECTRTYMFWSPSSSVLSVALV